MDRWTVRTCPEHGIVREVSVIAQCPVEVSFKCPCRRRLSEPFEVVRAQGARSSDPQTSKLAALRQKPRSGSQRERILHMITAIGPLTARQAAQATRVNGAWKRISELVQGGHLFVVGQVEDEATGAMVSVYGVKPSSNEPSLF